MSKEALKLALDALKYHTEQTRPIGNTNEVMAVIEEVLNYSECNCNQGQSCHVCDPIHPALAAPVQQEPVYLVWLKAHCAWLHTDKDGFDKTDLKKVGCFGILLQGLKPPRS